MLRSALGRGWSFGVAGSQGDGLKEQEGPLGLRLDEVGGTHIYRAPTGCQRLWAGSFISIDVSPIPLLWVCTGVKDMGSGARLPGFKPQLYHFLEKVLHLPELSLSHQLSLSRLFKKMH